MSIIVCIKQVPDTETKIYPLPDHSDIEEENIQWILNPYDEYALEESLLFKEKMEALEKNRKTQTTKENSQRDSLNSERFKVHAISLGPLRTKEILIKALAMGADFATHIQTNLKLNSLIKAKALASAIQLEKKTTEMIFTGKLSIDENQSAVPQMLAEFLNIPHATLISKLDLLNAEFSPSNSSPEQKTKIRVKREIEQGGHEVLEIQGPAVIGTTKGLNHPRTISIPNLIKAKRKPIKVLDFEKLDSMKKGFENSKSLIEDLSYHWQNFSLPKKRKSVHMIEKETTKEAVKTLIQKLREVEKLL